MKTNTSLAALILLFIISSCTKSIDYSQEHINQTSGRYLYNADEVIDVFYENNSLFLKWKGADALKPVAMDENTFFIPDMYKKLRFVKHPDTQERYLGIVSEEEETITTFDYLKVADSFETPSMHLKLKNYDAALSGYMEIKKQDSTQTFFYERDFNRKGYNFLGDKDYDDAIAVFKMNVALYPDSENTYDSLADAYAMSGDSLNAYVNYKKVLELNTGNTRAKKFIEVYDKNKD